MINRKHLSPINIRGNFCFFEAYQENLNIPMFLFDYFAW